MQGNIGEGPSIHGRPRNSKRKGQDQLNHPEGLSSSLWAVGSHPQALPTPRASLICTFGSESPARCGQCLLCSERPASLWGPPLLSAAKLGFRSSAEASDLVKMNKRRCVGVWGWTWAEGWGRRERAVLGLPKPGSAARSEVKA